MTLSDAYLCTPRDWEQEHRRLQLEQMAGPQSQQHQELARRFGLCAKIMEAQARHIAELTAQMEQMAASAKELME